MVVVVLGGVAAFAYWASSGTGAGSAATTTVNQGNKPSAEASGTKVELTWAASTLANGVNVTGYDVVRHDDESEVTVCSAVATNSCYDQEPAASTVRYGVVPRMGSSWTGPESDLSDPFTFDSTAPATIISRSPVEPTSSWHSTDVQITLTADDGTGSGVKEIYYKLNNGADQISTANPTVFTVSREDSNALEFWAIDNAGNAETPHQSATVKLDKTRPSTSASVTSGTAGNNGYYRSSVSVTLVPTDASPNLGAQASGVARTEYQVTGSNTVPSSWTGAATGTTVPVTAEGTSYVWFRSTDTAGNVELVTTPFIVKIDSIAPVVQATPSTSPNGAGWWKSNVTVTLTGSETSTPSSGVTSVEYQTSLNGGTFGAPVSYDAANKPVVSSEGTTVINARAIDAAGNTGSFTSVLTVKLDKTNPTGPTFTVAPSSPIGTNGWYKTAPTITISGGTDTAGSGIGGYEYQANGTGGFWTGYVAAITVTDSAAYQLFARALDLAGNISGNASTATLKVDATPPTISSVYPSTGDYKKGTVWAPGSTTNGACDKGIVCADVSDPTSTVATVTYTRDTGSAVTMTRTSGTAASGTWTSGAAESALPSGNGKTVSITVTVTDVAGNLSSYVSTLTTIN
jgi:hypothetical protein